MGRELVVGCSVFFSIGGSFVILTMLLVGVSALHRKNTGGVGTLTAVTIERFNVCNGDIYFVTGQGERSLQA